MKTSTLIISITTLLVCIVALVVNTLGVLEINKQTALLEKQNEKMEQLIASLSKVPSNDWWGDMTAQFDHAWRAGQSIGQDISDMSEEAIEEASQNLETLYKLVEVEASQSIENFVMDLRDNKNFIMAAHELRQFVLKKAEELGVNEDDVDIFSENIVCSSCNAPHLKDGHVKEFCCDQDSSIFDRDVCHWDSGKKFCFANNSCLE